MNGDTTLYVVSIHHIYYYYFLLNKMNELIRKFRFEKRNNSFILYCKCKRNVMDILKRSIKIEYIFVDGFVGQCVFAVGTFKEIDFAFDTD